jgi:alkaline phosphatase D
LIGKQLNLRLFLILLLGFAGIAHAQKPAAKPESVDKRRVLQRIVFGSCTKTTLPLTIFRSMADQKPDLAIQLGDNVYSENKVETLPEKYAFLKNAPEYQALLKACPMIGTWDDNDYGLSDGGKEHTAKDQAKQYMLDFLDIAADAPVRHREGVYQSYTYGPKGKQVKVILLDNRWFRDKQLRDDKGYIANPDGDVLGEAQWQWLENELRTSKAKINIIASGTQVISEEHRFEKWANFPKARARLFALIGQSKAQGVVLISGDRHVSEISRLDTTAVPYPMFDITSSGFTHVYETFKGEPNHHRVGDWISKISFGEFVIEWTPVRKKGIQHYPENLGRKLADFDRNPTLTLQFRAQDGHLLREEPLPIFMAKGMRKKGKAGQ